LALLARTVAILPQERTRLQRQRVLGPAGTLNPGAAWLPATLAVLVCGLQVSFWQHATTCSIEMFHLFLLAFVLRCLAEFRLDGKESWLLKAALTYGLGMADDYVLIAFLPLFLGTVAWLKGTAFFNFQFLVRFSLLWCAGLLIYLLIPIAHAASDTSINGFWGSLRAYLGGQKYAILGYKRINALLLSMVSLFPLLGLAFRWGEGGGDISGASGKITTLAVHLISLAFLALGLAIPFEVAGSRFSLRHLGVDGGGGPAASLLTIFYLSSLSIGYYAGYLYSVFGTPSIHRWDRTSPIGKALASGVVALLFIALAAEPAALLYTSWAPRSAAHGPELERLAKRLAAELPNGSMAISDTDIFRLLTKAGLAAAGRSKEVIDVSSGGLRTVVYHRYMHKAHPAQWPDVQADFAADGLFQPRLVNQKLTLLSQSNVVYYTEPSFGYFFEAHYLEPQGLVSRLHPLPATVIEPPAPSAAAVAQAVAYWGRVASEEFPSLLSSLPKRTNTPPSNVSAAMVRMSYSRMLNYWGVVAERAGFRKEAGELFQRAVAINPINPCAYLNLRYNQQLQANGSPFVEMDKSVAALFRAASQADGMEGVLRDHGPVDETGNLLFTSQLFAQGQDYLQAAQMVKIAGARFPDSSEYTLSVAKLLNQAGRPDLALTTVDQLRAAAPAAFTRSLSNSLEILEVESRALFRVGNWPKAESLLKEAITRHPTEDAPYSTLVSLHIQRALNSSRQGNSNDFTAEIHSAQEILKSQLAQQPRNSSAWVNYGATFMRLGDHSGALPALNQAVSLERTNSAALLNRAICNLRTGQLDGAQADYLQLYSQLAPDPPYPVLYGLGEVAFRKNQKKEAAQFFRKYLDRAPESEEADGVRKRLKSL
ncbi:MAG TPA: hypothetical protein DCM86_00425, partial [Verrucomicrobiales bacterium]|nr:hypothetical protein [Verrucomicrobiales bacterium]